MKSELRSQRSVEVETIIHEKHSHNPICETFRLTNILDWTDVATG